MRWGKGNYKTWAQHIASLKTNKHKLSSMHIHVMEFSDAVKKKKQLCNDMENLSKIHS